MLGYKLEAKLYPKKKKSKISTPSITCNCRVSL